MVRGNPMVARVMCSPQVGMPEGECAAPAFGASQTARTRNLDENEIVGGDLLWEWENGEGLWMAPEWKRGMDTGMEALFKADSVYVFSRGSLWGLNPGCTTTTSPFAQKCFG